ncbi:MAG: helix-hairpin-helix domain-containing protein [Verrucomicrobia bacterium]|nr:helix-hairpin-helix domain-containing protein [Verrucomicrobiota bacterium]
MMKTMRWLVPVFAGLVLFTGALCASAENGPFTRLAGAVLVAQAGNDGDSFLIEAEGRRIRIRLYFVDTPELEASWDVDVRRVREQMRYFGLPNERKVIGYGQQAAAFVRGRLAAPFEVYTSFASALGRSPDNRVYAFVRTADGRDLGEWLVQEGLARAYGVGREMPDGTSRDEMRAHLADLEATAMLKRAGIWASTDSERLAVLRAEQRKEDGELRAVRLDLHGAGQPSFPLDINTCTVKELESVRGIGPTLARRIVEARPHSTLENLLKIRGIRPAQLQTWREFLVAN